MRKNKAQTKVGKVMGEFKRGTLRSSSGQKVTNPKQAVAIGMSEAGLSKPKPKKKAPAKKKTARRRVAKARARRA